MAASRPNVLFIMTDEERYPPPYEHDALADFRRTQLPARERLRAQSRELHRHYTGATACTPSRTTLFTGQYASLHGVADTAGLAKAATDPGMHFLDADTVPTMGDWFRAAGYRTHYRGKWHISHPDLVIPGTHESLSVNDADGVLGGVVVREPPRHRVHRRRVAAARLPAHRRLDPRRTRATVAVRLVRGPSRLPTPVQ